MGTKKQTTDRKRSLLHRGVKKRKRGSRTSRVFSMSGKKKGNIVKAGKSEGGTRNLKWEGNGTSFVSELSGPKEKRGSGTGKGAGKLGILKLEKRTGKKKKPLSGGGGRVARGIRGGKRGRFP